MALSLKRALSIAPIKWTGPRAHIGNVRSRWDYTGVASSHNKPLSGKDAQVEPLQLYFTLAGAGLSSVVWLVRLEGKVKAQEHLTAQLENSISLLREKHENLDSKIVGELTRIRESLARLEGRLAGRDDINS